MKRLAGRGPVKKLPTHLYINFRFDNISDYDEEDIIDGAEIALDELFVNFCMAEDCDAPLLKIVTNLHHANKSKEDDIDYDEYNYDVKCKIFNEDNADFERDDDSVFDKEMATQFMNYIKQNSFQCLDNTIMPEDITTIEVK